MTKIINKTQRVMTINFLSLLLIAFLTSVSFSGDLNNGKDAERNLIFTNIFALATDMNFDHMSISYNGLSNDGEMVFQSEMNLYSSNLSELSDPDYKNFPEEMFKIDRMLEEMTRYLLKYFDIGDDSSENFVTISFLESKVKIHALNYKDFEFDLSLNVGYDTNTVLKMNAVKLESYWRNTHVNAIYNYEKNEIELGLSNVYLNDYLFKGMKVEFHANPSTGSGAVLLTKTF